MSQPYRVSRDGKEIKPITQGAFDYIQEVGADMDKGFVYFIASPDNFTQRYSLDGHVFFGNGESCVSPLTQSGNIVISCHRPANGQSIHSVTRKLPL